MSDFDSAWSVAECFASDRSETSAIIDAAEKRCRRLLTKHWDAVAALAEALLVSGRVEYEEAVEIVSAASPHTIPHCEWHAPNRLSEELQTLLDATREPSSLIVASK